MNLITLDFETYFADDYTLSKMTTESYVRNPRFKAHCEGRKINDAPVKVGIDPLRLDDCAALAHHAQFDGLILAHHYDLRPALWFDTMSMARLLYPHGRHSLAALTKQFGLAEKTVPYNLFKGVRDLPPDIYRLVADGCAHDVELTHAIFKRMLPHVPKSELRIIDLTIRMFTEPALRLDRDLLTEYVRNTREEKDDLLSDCGITREDVGSADKFAALLRGLGVEPPVKLSKTTGKEAYAFAKTDAGLKSLLDHDDDRVVVLVEARLGVKSNMVEKRAERLLDMDTRGALCVYLAYAKAHTLRFAGGDKMNWQNLKRGSVLRSSLLAPEGRAVVVVDASQIEARLLNWFYGQWDILEKFRNKEDIYSQLATQFYGEHVDKSKPEKRGTGKQIELSCGYRAGADSIQNTARVGTYGPPVHLTDDQALAARDLYRSTHPKVVEGWKYCDDVVLPALYAGAELQWGVLLIRDHKLYFPGEVAMDYSTLERGTDKWGKPSWYRRTTKGLANIHGGIVTQNIMECFARIILCDAMLKLSVHFKVVTCTHDEIVYLAPLKGAQYAFEYGVALLKIPPAWAPELPLDAEGGHDVRYSK